MPDSKPNARRVSLLKDRNSKILEACKLQARLCDACVQEFFRDLLKPGYVNTRIEAAKKAAKQKLKKGEKEAKPFFDPDVQVNQNLYNIIIESSSCRFPMCIDSWM